MRSSFGRHAIGDSHRRWQITWLDVLFCALLALLLQTSPVHAVVFDPVALLNSIHGDLVSWVDFSSGSHVYVAQVVLPGPPPVPSLGLMGLLGLSRLRA